LHDKDEVRLKRHKEHNRSFVEKKVLFLSRQSFGKPSKPSKNWHFKPN
jgi:hypothetical protein